MFLMCLKSYSCDGGHGWSYACERYNLRRHLGAQTTKCNEKLEITLVLHNDRSIGHYIGCVLHLDHAHAVCDHPDYDTAYLQLRL